MAQSEQQPYSFGQVNNDQFHVQRSRRNIIFNHTRPTPPSNEEIIRKGYSLFRNFVHEEAILKQVKTVATLQRYDATLQDLPVVDMDEANEPQHAMSQDTSFECASLNQDIRSYDECDNAFVSKLGKDLRKIADEFAASAARQKVKKKAEEINTSQLSPQKFNRLLVELFSDGFNTTEGIVTLFFFCSDLILKGRYIDYCIMGMMWSCSFIRNHVGNWIYQNGGWEKVLCVMGGYVKKTIHTFSIAAVGMAAVAVGVAAVVYIRKNT